jgi:hypothetical protein
LRFKDITNYYSGFPNGNKPKHNFLSKYFITFSLIILDIFFSLPSSEILISSKILAIQGNIVANQGDIGEVYKVVRNNEEVAYQVIFGDRILQLPESALIPLGESIHE